MGGGGGMGGTRAGAPACPPWLCAGRQVWDCGLCRAGKRPSWSRCTCVVVLWLLHHTRPGLGWLPRTASPPTAPPLASKRSPLAENARTHMPRAAAHDTAVRQARVRGGGVGWRGRGRGRRLLLPPRVAHLHHVRVADGGGHCALQQRRAPAAGVHLLVAVAALPAARQAAVVAAAARARHKLVLVLQNLRRHTRALGFWGVKNPFLKTFSFKLVLGLQHLRHTTRASGVLGLGCTHGGGVGVCRGFGDSEVQGWFELGVVLEQLAANAEPRGSQWAKQHHKKQHAAAALLVGSPVQSSPAPAPWPQRTLTATTMPRHTALYTDPKPPRPMTWHRGAGGGRQGLGRMERNWAEQEGLGGHNWRETMDGGRRHTAPPPPPCPRGQGAGWQGQGQGPATCLHARLSCFPSPPPHNTTHSRIIGRQSTTHRHLLPVKPPACNPIP